MKKNTITLQTYPVGNLPEGIQYGNDTISDEWLDSHLTEFEIEEDELEKVLLELEIPSIGFINSWIYDDVFQIYHATNNIINERFISTEL